MIEHQYYFADSRYDTLLLIHGWNTSKLYMESFVRPFSNAFNVLLLDLFVHIDKAYAIGDFIEEIHAIVERHLTNDLVIIGHSFGGKLAYFYAEKYPVRSLVLIAPSLVRPRRSLRKAIKVFLYKAGKKLRCPIPRFLSGSPDYRNASGAMRETFSPLRPRVFDTAKRKRSENAGHRLSERRGGKKESDLEDPKVSARSPNPVLSGKSFFLSGLH